MWFYTLVTLLLILSYKTLYYPVICAFVRQTALDAQNLILRTPAYSFCYLFNEMRVSLSPVRHGNSRRPAYSALSVTALIGLVALTFHLLTSK